ncbi:MAG: monofunctional biosynthetic peptidoglycan transglycosylase [Desulfomonilaceae bacterium]|nr:monofunctional biosynthetic peptidoglycan transglycosylase [Desulfomonilaceae bacterium]
MSKPRTDDRISRIHAFLRRAGSGLRVCLNAIRRNRGSPPRSRTARLFAVLKRSIICFLALSIAVVVLFGLVPPFTSAVMIVDRLERFASGKNQASLRYQWASLEEISPQVPLAVVAAEDQCFPDHWGFDVGSIRKAMEDHARGRPLRGASTITQQTAKNLFLWNGRSYVRKGLEAYFSVLLELLWPKTRILEVYLNIAEFGDGVYGVRAAAETYLHKSPSALTRRDAALLAAVLPNPKRFKVARPSAHVRSRSLRIMRQMELLGGVGYLEDL